LIDYEEAAKKPETERERIKPIYLWIPAIVTFLVVIITAILKFAEKTPGGFTTWGWIIAIWFLTLLITFGASMAAYLLLSIKNKKPAERAFNRREFCDNTLRSEIRKRTGYNLEDFTETGDSIEGVGWFGAGSKKDDQNKIYYHLYRIQHGTKKRYLLGVMNMEAGDEDSVTLVQSPMNFQGLQELITETCNRLCKNPQQTVMRESIYRDEVSGRERIEREKSPFDRPENEDVDEGVRP
jgi:hypothetical protein